uniref:Uncharacterized protein n=1 Tax=Romanomermis culicivorax TaxID=13658 RepID=A0A915HWB2_ROMCU
MSNVESVMENIDAKLDENHNNTAEDNVQSDQSTEAQCHDITAILGTQSNESPDLDGNSSFEVLFNSGFDTTENTNLTGNTPEDQLTVIKRLSQIKEYKKQVLMTMNQLKGEGPEVDKDILRKLIDSYDNFKRQEEQYLEVLQNILVSKQKLALTVLDENSTDNKYADQPNASGTSSNQDSPLINPQILQTMINQQEDLRALHGHIVASQNNQHQDVERSSNSKSEQDLLTAQKSVENQAASLAAKRKLLEDLKARLSLYSDLSNKTTLELKLFTPNGWCSYACPAPF